MKLKYYLRGLGTGVIVATIVLAISFSARKTEISEEEIVARAMQLGMVMPETESEAEDADVQSSGEDGAESGVPDADSVQAGDSEGAEDVIEPNGAAPGDDQVEEGSQPGADQNAGGTPAEEVGTPGASAETGMTTSPADAGTQTGSYRLTIQRGDVCRVVCENLATNGVVSDAESLRRYLFEIGYASNMSVGEYEIPYGLTNEEIAAILKAGPLE